MSTDILLVLEAALAHLEQRCRCATIRRGVDARTRADWIAAHLECRAAMLEALPYLTPALREEIAFLTRGRRCTRLVRQPDGAFVPCGLPAVRRGTPEDPNAYCEQHSKPTKENHG